MKYLKIITSKWFGMVWMYTALSSSCGVIYPSHHFAYAPTGTNTPFLKEKNQLNISGNTTTVENDKDADGLNIGMQVKAAYAVTNHFGVTASFFAAKEKDKYNGDSDGERSLSYKRRFIEVSAGYFSAANAKKNIYLEFYGGYGLGRNTITESYNPGYGDGFYRNNYNLFYLQPAIILHHRNFFQTGLFLRTSFVRFGSVTTNYSDDVLIDDDVKLYGLDKENFIFFQPVASLRAPLSKQGNLHLNFEISGSFKVSGVDIYNRKVLGAVGITYAPLGKK